jgi:hypothetical protein
MLAGITTGAWGAATGLGQEGAGNARLAKQSASREAWPGAELGPDRPNESRGGTPTGGPPPCLPLGGCSEGGAAPARRGGWTTRLSAFRLPCLFCEDDPNSSETTAGTVRDSARKEGNRQCRTQSSGAHASRERSVIASQRVRPEVAGPMTGSAKQSSAARELDCFVASLLAMTAHPHPRKRERMKERAPRERKDTYEGRTNQATKRAARYMERHNGEVARLRVHYCTLSNFGGPARSSYAAG